MAGFDLTGINNINEYYTNHYLNTIFADSLKTQVKAWSQQAETETMQTPWSRLRQTRHYYYPARELFQRQRLDADTFNAIIYLPYPWNHCRLCRRNSRYSALQIC